MGGGGVGGGTFWVGGSGQTFFMGGWGVNGGIFWVGGSVGTFLWVSGGIFWEGVRVSGDGHFISIIRFPEFTQ